MLYDVQQRKLHTSYSQAPSPTAYHERTHGPLDPPQPHNHHTQLRLIHTLILVLFSVCLASYCAPKIRSGCTKSSNCRAIVSLHWRSLSVVGLSVSGRFGGICPGRFLQLCFLAAPVWIADFSNWFLFGFVRLSSRAHWSILTQSL